MMFEAEDESFLVRFHPAKKKSASPLMPPDRYLVLLSPALEEEGEKKRQKEEAKKEEMKRLRFGSFPPRPPRRYFVYLAKLR